MGRSYYASLEPVQDLDQWMQHKAKVDEKAQDAGVCEHLSPLLTLGCAI